MSGQTGSTITIGAAPGEVMDVIADVPAYPQWDTGVAHADILDPGVGRPTQVRVRVEAGAVADIQIRDYEWSGNDRVSWTLHSSDRSRPPPRQTRTHRRTQRRHTPPRPRPPPSHHRRRRTPLNRKEFHLLALLASHPDQVQSREHLVAEVWHSTWSTTSRTLDVHIARLRSKLSGRARIETIRGIGYQLSLIPTQRNPLKVTPIRRPAGTEPLPSDQVPHPSRVRLTHGIHRFEHGRMFVRSSTCSGSTRACRTSRAERPAQSEGGSTPGLRAEAVAQIRAGQVAARCRRARRAHRSGRAAGGSHDQHGSIPPRSPPSRPHPSSGRSGKTGPAGPPMMTIASYSSRSSSIGQLLIGCACMPQGRAHR